MADATVTFGDPRIPARFWAQVERRPSGCWLWTGTLKPDGYGVYSKPPAGVSQYVHRRAYQVLVGPIPDGMQIDHLCHNASTCTLGDACPHRRCLNPSHLEPVTSRVNTRRSGGLAAQNIIKSHCPAGHPYDVANTIIDGNKRRCRICRGEQLRRAGLAWYYRDQAKKRSA